MRSFFVALVIVGACSAGLASSGFAQEGETDRQFVEKAVMSEIVMREASTQAQQQVKDAQIRKLAEQVVKEGDGGEQGLVAIARQSSLDIPGEIDTEHRARLGKMRDQPNPDRAYLELMLTALGESISLIDGYLRIGKNEALRNWGERTLPVLRERLELAKTAAA